MKKLTEEELQDVISRAKEVCIKHIFIRYGQALFNCLYDSHPELANSIRATNLDPFYSKEGNPKIDDFLKALV